MPIDEKLTKIFVSIRGGLARTVSGIVPPREVEDIVQETYVRVVQARGNDEIRSPQSFMYRTARNIALNHMNRAESRLADSLNDMNEGGKSGIQDSIDDTLNQVCTDEEFSFFCEAVRTLPVKCRRAFVLKKIYGYSYREISVKLGISEKTVEKHISKGITNCRSYMLQRKGAQQIQRASIGRSGGHS